MLFNKNIPSLKQFILIGFIFIAVSCKNEEKNKETASSTVTRQEVTVQQNEQEEDFQIIAEYDPILAEKAAKSKENKTEKPQPIPLTPDDDDLEKDNDDVSMAFQDDSRKMIAYDYKSQYNEVLTETENTSKGSNSIEKSAVGKGVELFFVVAGAFSNEKQAQEKVAKIKELGYQVELITFDGNFKTVCVAKLENRKQADFLAQELQSKSVDAYVVKRRE
jgi:hypothetical protein